MVKYSDGKLWALLTTNMLLQKDEVYLNLVLEFIPETVYKVARHYSKAKQTIPLIYIKVSNRLVTEQTKLD